MELVALAPIVAALCLGAMSPGPSLVVLLRNTREGGRSRGLACGVGHGIGFSIYAFAAVSGIVFLKQNASESSRWLEILGGIFLLFLSIMMFRQNVPKISHERHSKARGFSEGFLVAFLNPKILAFLVAIFSQFVQPDFTMMDRLLIAGIAMLTDGGWYVLVALLVSGTKFTKIIEDHGRKIDLTLAILLAIYGLAILFH